MMLTPTLPLHATHASVDLSQQACANELALGLQAGTNRRFLLMGEMSASLFGGFLQVVCQITAEDLRS